MKGVITVLALMTIAGCGGSGGGSSTQTPPASYSLSGRVQKGPFVVGSEITVNALDASLNPTGTVYNTQTTDAVGDFSVASPVSASQVEIIAQGFYIDELTGQLSTAQIQLRTISNLTANSSPTVNVLTTLQEQRLKTLVAKGSTIAAATTQSESEVLTLFGINAASISSLSTLDSMRVDGTTDEDAVLLAVSAILSQIATDSAKANGTTEAAELSNLVNTIAAGIADAGTLSSSTFIPARNLANTEINAAMVTSNLQAYYAKNGVTVTAPPFVEWVDQSNSGVLPQRLVPVTGLNFSAVTAANPGQPITSNVVTIAGAGAGVTVPVIASPGITIIKDGVAIAGQYATAEDGDTIAVQIAPLGFDQTSNLTLSVGSSSAQWDVKSIPLGGTISGLTGTGLTLQDNLGDSTIVSSGATSFSFPAQVAPGKGYIVSVMTQPGSPPEVCDVSGGSGTVGTGAANINIVCSAPAGIAYITNFESSANSISEYLIDASTGSLIDIGTIATGASPGFIAADPMGQHVYVANSGSTTVSAYYVTGTGALSSIGTFAAGTGPLSVAVNPSGTFEYVANVDSSNVSEFTIDPTTGALTNIGTVAASGLPNFITVDPTGRFAYTTNNNSSNITAFTIDPATGQLTNQGTVACPLPQAIAIERTGQFAYVPCGNGTGIQAYGIDQTTGTLTNIGSYASGSEIVTVSVDPAGKFAYFSNWGNAGALNDNSIDTYSIDSTSGALTSTGSIATNNPEQFTVDPSGNWLLTRDNSSNIGTYKISRATGALTYLGASPNVMASPSAIGIINVQ